MDDTVIIYSTLPQLVKRYIISNTTLQEHIKVDTGNALLTIPLQSMHVSNNRVVLEYYVGSYGDAKGKVAVTVFEDDSTFVSFMKHIR